MNKPHILLIEDDAWLAESYTHVLKSTYLITTVASSVAAMESIDSEPFDLIIADVMLENGLVIDLLHELQTHGDTMNTPVIICSSLASSIDIRNLRSYGVVEVLDKSTLTIKGLRIAIQRAFVSKVV